MMIDYNDVKEDIIKQLNNMVFEGDLSDIGNEIGVAVGKYHNVPFLDFEDLISGIKHGISLSDGTHK